jgi:hypothetical protein
MLFIVAWIVTAAGSFYAFDIGVTSPRPLVYRKWGARGFLTGVLLLALAFVLMCVQNGDFQ